MHPLLPEIHSFEIVARLPDSLRRGARSDWSTHNLDGRELDAFLEAPVFDGEGNLFLADIPFGRILCLSQSNEWSLVAEYDGWPNGMKFVNRDTLLVADHKRGLVEVACGSGRDSVVCAGFEGKPFHGLNDLTLAANGDVYFTDQGRSGQQAPYGRVFRWRVGGEPRLLIEGVPSPNGLVLSQDEKTLFLAVTRANAVWRLPLDETGAVNKAGLFIQMSGGIGPDGLARPPDGGGLLVAQPGLGVWQFRDNGTPRRLWQGDGFPYPTNLAEHPRRPGIFYVTESLSATVLGISLKE